jgi:hypothetical protein
VMVSELTKTGDFFSILFRGELSCIFLILIFDFYRGLNLS